MPARKQRNQQHMMEDDSKTLLRNAIPREWVIHDYKPDYGIDCVVEVFEYVEGSTDTAETLGEMFFVQLKSIASTTKETERVYERLNVEKWAPSHKNGAFLDIEVIKIDIDVSELLTIKAMGVGLPVLLVVACLDIRSVYYVCLNDLIDKILDPSSQDYASQKTKRISVPTLNELSPEPCHTAYPRFLAKRSKFMAAFAKFEYQRNELVFCIRNMGHEPARNMAIYFIKRLNMLDIWSGCEMWSLVSHYREQLNEVESLLSDNSVLLELRMLRACTLWEGLVAMGHTYEEICREWNLPTYLAQLLSYPNQPDS